MDAIFCQNFTHQHKDKNCKKTNRQTDRHIDTYPQFSDHSLDEVVSKLHPLQASLGGGDGVEDGCVYLVHVLLAVKSGKLPDNALRSGDRRSVGGKVLRITHPDMSLFFEFKGFAATVQKNLGSREKSGKYCSHHCSM